MIRLDLSLELADAMLLHYQLRWLYSCFKRMCQLIVKYFSLALSRKVKNWHHKWKKFRCSESLSLNIILETLHKITNQEQNNNAFDRRIVCIWNERVESWEENNFCVRGDGLFSSEAAAAIFAFPLGCYASWSTWRKILETYRFIPCSTFSRFHY